MTAGFRTLAGVFVLLVAGVHSGFAQSTLGTIRGTVFDPQHQIVPGATVVATDEATNVSRETTTDGDGNFEMPNLRSGTYTVEARLSGFKTVKRTGLLLRTAAVARADLQLELGSLNEAVSVPARGTTTITPHRHATTPAP